MRKVLIFCLEEWKNVEVYGLIIRIISRVSSRLFVEDDLYGSMAWRYASRGKYSLHMLGAQLLTERRPRRERLQVDHSTSDVSTMDEAIRRSICAVCLDREISLVQGEDNLGAIGRQTPQRASRWHARLRREVRQPTSIHG